MWQEKLVEHYADSIRLIRRARVNGNCEEPGKNGVQLAMNAQILPMEEFDLAKWLDMHV